MCPRKLKTHFLLSDCNKGFQTGQNNTNRFYQEKKGIYGTVQKAKYGARED